MLLQRDERDSLNSLFQALKLKSNTGESGKNKTEKIEQILAYLEIIHSEIRKYSKQRPLVFIDGCAGNCYLSFLVYYYYTEIEERPITIHCVDKNEKLMNNSKLLAQHLGFADMQFHACDILDYNLHSKVELVYSLHACDSATDKTLYLGMENKAASILSVTCCQHSLKKNFRNSRYRGITKHSVFKDRMLYMVGDSLRALLLEMGGYKADIFEFTSSRYTDKNIMIRARKGNSIHSLIVKEEYQKIRDELKVSPALETYINFTL